MFIPLGEQFDRHLQKEAKNERSFIRGHRCDSDPGHRIRHRTGTEQCSRLLGGLHLNGAAGDRADLYDIHKAERINLVHRNVKGNTMQIVNQQTREYLVLDLKNIPHINYKYEVDQEVQLTRTVLGEPIFVSPKLWTTQNY